VRKGANQKILGRICVTTEIFNAWSDEEWINEGAAVRVSLVCFGSLSQRGRAEGGGNILNDTPVATIHADLTTGVGLNLTQTKPQKENAAVVFEGTKKYGDFDIPGELARQWLKQPNPNGRLNSDVIRPWANGQDVTSRPSDTWIVDFGTDKLESDACLYELAYQQVLVNVKPYRQTFNRERTRRNWWLHEEARVALRLATRNLSRFIATPRVAKYRFFVWFDTTVLPDTGLCVIAREDDSTIGVLSSHIHEVWALANASRHGVGNEPTYNGKSCFETFPFPEGMTSNLSPENYTNPAAAEIAHAAQALNKLRDNWLNPPEWVDWVRTPEEEAGYPSRPVAKNVGLKPDLQKRTLTNLYNLRPTWLDNAHKTLDAAVAKAYGWNENTAEMADEEILRRLLALNLAST
jgi:type II restriction/modification system DNA methylase subunit YeeA